MALSSDNNSASNHNNDNVRFNRQIILANDGQEQVERFLIDIFTNNTLTIRQCFIASSTVLRFIAQMIPKITKAMHGNEVLYKASTEQVSDIIASIEKQFDVVVAPILLKNVRQKATTRHLIQTIILELASMYSPHIASVHLHAFGRKKVLKTFYHTFVSRRFYWNDNRSVNYSLADSLSDFDSNKEVSELLRGYVCRLIKRVDLLTDDGFIEFINLVIPVFSLIPVFGVLTCEDMVAYGSIDFYRQAIIRVDSVFWGNNPLCRMLQENPYVDMLLRNYSSMPQFPYIMFSN